MIGYILLSIFLATGTLLRPPPSYAITLHVSSDTNFEVRTDGQDVNYREKSDYSGRKFRNDSDKGTIFVHHTRKGRQSIGLAQFDLGPLPPDASIQRALLRIWISKLRQEGTLRFHDILAQWDEDAPPRSVLPPLGPVIHSLPLTQNQQHTFLMVDVTSLVQDWLNSPSSNFGLALVSDEEDVLDVETDSKENRRTSHPMEIEVTIAPGNGPMGPPGATGPTGPQGPPGPVLLLGQNCPPQEYLSGFDPLGNILCTPLPFNPSPEPPSVQDVNPGDIIITEFMADPQSVIDTNGEWFEIVNLRSDVVDLSGWLIQEANGNTHTVSANTPFPISPGEFVVFGLNSDPTTNGGIPVIYQYSGISLNNGGDSITLIEVAGEIIDQVDYSNNAFVIAPGISLSLDPNHFNGSDNDQSMFWCSSTTTIGPGQDSGTPGTANLPCP